MQNTDPRLVVSIAEAARLVGLSRAGFYPIVMSGECKSIVVGRRRLIPLASLKEWVESRPSDVRGNSTEQNLSDYPRNQRG